MKWIETLMTLYSSTVQYVYAAKLAQNCAQNMDDTSKAAVQDGS